MIILDQDQDKSTFINVCWLLVEIYSRLVMSGVTASKKQCVICVPCEVGVCIFSDKTSQITSRMRYNYTELLPILYESWLLQHLNCHAAGMSEQKVCRWTHGMPVRASSLKLECVGPCQVLIKARLITVSRPRTSKNLMFNKMKWLSLQQRRYFHKCILVYKCRMGLAPQYLYDMFIANNSNHSYNTRNTTQLRSTITRTACYYRSFTVSGLNLWNIFLTILKNVHLYQVLNGLSTPTWRLNHSFMCILSLYQFYLL